jgi:hypothetical protein
MRVVNGPPSGPAVGAAGRLAVRRARATSALPENAGGSNHRWIQAHVPLIDSSQDKMLSTIRVA